MNNLPFEKDGALNTQRMIESIMLKKIVKLCPEAGQYESRIKFNHEHKKASLDLSLLPAELSTKIAGLLA